MRKRAISLILCALLLLPSTLVNAASSQRFNDLPTDHWAYSAVMDMVGKGILEGFEDGTFRPNDSVTRAQFAKILVLAMNIPQQNSGTQTFTDVTRDDWSYSYVEAVRQYLTGYKQGGQLYFRGTQQAVREDMAVAIVMAKGLDSQTPNLSVLDTYTDKEQISPSLRGYAAIAVKNKVMEGDGNYFYPQSTLTRAEACALIYKSSIANGSGEKVVVKDAGVGKDYKVYNDGNITFNYPMEFDMEDVTSAYTTNGSPNYVPGFSYNSAMNSDITINVSYTNLGIKSTTLDGVFEYWNGLNSKVSSPTNQALKLGESVVNQFTQDSLNSGTPMQAHIYGRGIGVTTPDIQIISNEVPNQMTSEDAVYYVKVRDVIANSLKVISPVQPISDTTNTTTPQVVSTTPANGATNVTLGTEIVINYDKAWKQFIPNGSGADAIQFIDNSTGEKVFRGISINDGRLELISSPFKTIKINFSSSDIKPNTNYTVKIPSGIMVDLAGNYNNEYSFSFVTKIAVDTIAIAKIQSVKLSIIPQITGNDKYVATVTLQKGSDTTVKVEGFSELYVASMDQYLKESDIQTIENTNGIVQISGIIPSGKAYSKIRVKARIVSVSKGIFDESEVTSNEFAINSEDTTAPTVVSTTPANGVINVATDAKVIMTFSENISKATGWTFASLLGGNLVGSGSEVSYSIVGSQVIFTPTSKLQAGKTYTAYLPSGAVKDAAGNVNQNEVKVVFTIAAAADTTAPTIVSTTPANGATNVTLGTEMVINYDKEWKQFVPNGSGADAIQFIDNSTGNKVFRGITINDGKLELVSSPFKTIKINFSSLDIKPNTSYTVKIPSGIMADSAGNYNNAYSFSFTTKP